MTLDPPPRSALSQVAREGYVHKGQVELARLAASSSSSSVRGSQLLRAGAAAHDAARA